MINHTRLRNLANADAAVRGVPMSILIATVPVEEVKNLPENMVILTRVDSKKSA